jgi:hypothetical protein
MTRAKRLGSDMTIRISQPSLAGTSRSMRERDSASMTASATRAGACGGSRKLSGEPPCVASCCSIVVSTELGLTMLMRTPVLALRIASASMSPRRPNFDAL